MTHPLPANYPITQAWGIKGTNWKACGVHTGVDLAAPTGTPAYATVAGTVRHRNYGAAFGDRCVGVVAADGSGEAFYAHLSERVADGTKVKPGDLVGRVGMRGTGATGPHLHYEWLATPGVWNCSNIRDPRPSIAAPAAGPAYTGAIRLSHLTFGVRDSAVVKELQHRLNGIKLVGGANLPVTGNYLEMTDAEVRKWQVQVCNDPADPVGKSNLGPKQAARMFPAPTYTITDDRAAAAAPTVPVAATPAPTPAPVPAWFLAPSLAALRAEVDAAWPARSKASDGTIGDTAHASGTSEHNPVGHAYGPKFGTPGAVHAFDITAAGIDVPRVLASLIGDRRVWYVIHTGSIWSKTYGWEKRPYTGSNPHTTHVHVSLAADDQAGALAAEKDTGVWLKPAAAEPVPAPEPEPGDKTAEIRLKVTITPSGELSKVEVTP